MPTALKRFVLAVFVLLSFLIGATPTFAALSAEDFAGWNDYTEVGAVGCLVGLPNIINLQDPGSAAKCPVSKNGVVAFVDHDPNAGFGAINNVMTAMYTNPPAGAGYYLADLGTNLGVVQPAYAQSIGGSGDGVLQPILEVWKVTRNISYLGFVFVFIAIGFMIMFRQKLNPQTVISVQAALPTLVIGMVLVTFSYFIAALIVDLSFVFMQLVAFLFQSVGGNNPFGNTGLYQAANGANIFNLFFQIGWNQSLLNNVAGPIKNSFQQAFPGGIFQTGAWFTGGVGAVIGGGLGLLVTAVLVVALFIQLMRLLWALVQAYLIILVNTIFGPFFILISTIPGRSSALSYWWKGIFGNMLIFPAVFGAFALAGMILGNSGTAGFTATPPLLEGFPAQLMRTVLAYGILLASPAIPNAVKSLLGVKDLGDFAKTAIQGAGAGLGLSRQMAGAGLNPVFGPAMKLRKTMNDILPAANAGSPREYEQANAIRESLNKTGLFNRLIAKPLVMGVGNTAMAQVGKGSQVALEQRSRAEKLSGASPGGRTHDAHNAAYEYVRANPTLEDHEIQAGYKATSQGYGPDHAEHVAFRNFAAEPANREKSAADINTAYKAQRP